MNTQTSIKPIYIFIGISIILSICSLWINYSSQNDLKEYYVKRDSSIEIRVSEILENIRSIDTIIQANNSLIRSNEGIIKNYYITNEVKSKQILSVPVDSGRVADVKRFLDSLYRTRLEEYQ
jgi:hypothetical protein